MRMAKGKRVVLAVDLAGLTCLTLGAWMLHPAAGMLTLGALLWFDAHMAYYKG